MCGDAEYGKGKTVKETIRKLTKNMWTIPNVLTMLRLVIVPFFVWAYLAGARWVALALFCAASLTDCLDGYLARKLNQITDFGKLMDPLADKLLVLTTLVLHTVTGIFPPAPVWIMAVKELLMVCGGAVMLKKGVVVHSNLWGKTATVFFVAALILGFFHAELAAAGVPADIWLLWVSVALSPCALMSYAIESWKQLKGR